MSAMTEAMTRTAADVPHERSLLIVEDDKSFLQRLARAMEGRGFVVTTAESVADGLLQLRHRARERYPDWIIGSDCAVVLHRRAAFLHGFSHKLRTAGQER